MKLFIAVYPKYNTLNALENAAESIREQSPECRFVSRDKIHLTMAYIGEAGPNILASAIEALDLVDLSAFNAKIDSTGRIGSTAVAFLKKEPKLAELRKTLTDAMDKCGVPYDRRVFTPHITLARNVPPDVIRPDIDADLSIDRLLLISSEIVDGRREYREMYSRELKHEYVTLEKSDMRG